MEYAKIDFKRSELKKWLAKKGCEYNKDVHGIECPELEALLLDIWNDVLSHSWRNHDIELLECLAYVDDYFVISGELFVPYGELKETMSGFRVIDRVVGHCKNNHLNKITSKVYKDKLDAKVGKVGDAHRMIVQELGIFWCALIEGNDDKIKGSRYNRILSMGDFSQINQYWYEHDRLYRLVMSEIVNPDIKKLAYFMVKTYEEHGFQKSVLSYWQYGEIVDEVLSFCRETLIKNLDNL